MKSIIVVADEKLRDHAINLVHAISKIEDMKASYFTPSKFRDNESEITGKNLTIFIGENDIAQPYLGVIKKKYNKHGIYWGFDGSKAGIVVDEIRLEEKKIKAEIDAIIVSSAAGATTLGASTIAVMTSMMPAFWAPAIVYFVYKYFAKKKRMREAEKLQYKLGVLSFMEKGFDEYITKAN